MRFCYREQQQFFTEFSAGLKSFGCQPGTIKCYETDLNRLFSWLKENGRKEINGTAADEFLSYLEKEGLNKAASLNRKKISYGRYLFWLREKGLAAGEEKLCYQFHNIHRLYREPGCLSREEVDLFLEGLNREYESLDSEFRKRVCLRDSLLFELLFYHSLEIGELVSMKVCDFDLEQRKIWITEKSGQRKSQKIYSDRLYQKLSMWKQERKEFVRNPKYSEMMFLTKLGTPMNAKFLVTVFEKYRKASGIEEKATPQFLKHSRKNYAESVMQELAGKEARRR